MTNVRLEKTWKGFFSDGAETEDYHRFDIIADDIKVGEVEVIDQFNEDNDTAYIERIDIDEEYRGQGIGTEVLTSTFYDECDYRAVIVAPDNEDAQRLYERIGNEYRCYNDDEYDFGYNDQGYGVYVI